MATWAKMINCRGVEFSRVEMAEWHKQLFSSVIKNLHIMPEGNGFLKAHFETSVLDAFIVQWLYWWKITFNHLSHSVPWILIPLLLIFYNNINVSAERTSKYIIDPESLRGPLTLMISHIYTFKFSPDKPCYCNGYIKEN